MYIRLDTLQEVNPDPSDILWGVAGPVGPLHQWAIKVKRAFLHKQWGEFREPFLPVSATWAVRLVEATSYRGRQAKIQHLIKRDGPTCLYCEEEIDPRTCTIEHIVAKEAGGPEHASNLALTCGPCNRAMGHLSAVEKVKLAMKFRIGELVVRKLKNGEVRIEKV